jgi:hypothetical protein
MQKSSAYVSLVKTNSSETKIELIEISDEEEEEVKERPAKSKHPLQDPIASSEDDDVIIIKSSTGEPSKRQLESSSNIPSFKETTAAGSEEVVIISSTKPKYDPSDQLVCIGMLDIPIRDINRGLLSRNENLAMFLPVQIDLLKGPPSILRFYLHRGFPIAFLDDKPANVIAAIQQYVKIQARISVPHSMSRLVL